MTETSLVRADLLLALENAGAVTPTELRLADGLPVERYEALARMVGQLASSARWWVGDLLVYGERNYGAHFPQLSEALNLSETAREEYARVAEAIPPNRRRPALSWSHHRIVSPRWVTPANREALLDTAERERLNARELEAHTRELRVRLDSGSTARKVPARPNASAYAGSGPPSGSTPSLSEAATDCEALVAEALAELHADLLDCGFGERLRVTVEVAAPNVALRTSYYGPGEEAVA